EYSYILKFSADNPYLFLIDPKGVIRNDWGYSPFTKDIFEGKGLFNEIDRVLSAGAPAPPKKEEAPPAARPPISDPGLLNSAILAPLR
ncbi:MAG: hypothetical protein LAQ30_19290, partial [Acidobacteriia bacterium]|nr:hypothetical protein [Terriglobia bacterium]